ncbi:MAG: dockerin type I repeat-containing protein, partial [candidate division Zixibacteria bacterium]|nr:dockerin type I repeat-containing protein [candidate division Zixibacteria bacterium]
DEIMISGVITYWTEKSFPVGSGVCTVENPINRQSTDVIVDADGSFSCQLMAAMEETGTFTASLGISTEYGIARSYFSFAVNDPAIGPPYDDNHQADFVVDMHLDMGQADDLPSQSTQNVSVKPGFWNQYWSSLSNSTVDNLVEPSKDLYRQEASFVTGGWKRTTESYSGKLAAGAFNAGVAKCSPISASGVSHCALGLGAVYVLGAETFSNTFNEAFHQLVDIASNPADPILTPEEAARGHVLADDISMILNVLRMKPTDGGLLKAVKTTMNAGFLVPKYIQLVNKHLDLNDKSGSGADNLESLSLIVVDSANDIIVIGVEPKAENMCVIQSFSPVRLSVTDPRGRVVDWMSSEVSGSRYFRMDTDQDGDSSTLVMIPLDTVGPVSVTVVPDAGAQPDDCFTILMDNTYYQTPIPLADNIPVSAIPAQPLVAETFQNLPPDSAQIITVDGAMFGEFPCAIQWHPAIDPNPGHIPSYRVVIARSEDYSDSVMVSVSSDTTYTVEASLLPAPKGSADTLHFYWKVIASDDWGEVAATAFRAFSVMVLCGDANSDSKINIGDAVYIVSYIFRNGPPPPHMGAGDANCDSKVNVGDAV